MRIVRTEKALTNSYLGHLREQVAQLDASVEKGPGGAFRGEE